jgi:hypothetical protein
MEARMAKNTIIGTQVALILSEEVKKETDRTQIIK